MNRRASLVLALLCLGGLRAAAHPVPRTVLVETFTNVSCSGCADANPVTHAVMDAHGRHELLNVQYHAGWPHPADPFYLPVAAAVDARVLAYGVMNLPDLYTCGEDRPFPADASGLEAAVAAARAGLTPLRLAVDLQWAGPAALVSVGVAAVDVPPTGELTLRIALVDENEAIVPAPGANGETEFHWTLRRLLPDAQGTAFRIAAGDSLVFRRAAIVDPAWDTADLHAVAWVQDDATNAILQAGGSLAPPAYAAAWYAERYGAVVPLGETFRADGWLENLGTATDTYNLTLTATTPGWQVSACVGDVCYPPWVTEFDVTLDAGAEAVVGVDVTPAGVAGTGEIVVTAVSDADPSLTLTRTFTILSGGTEVLLVDADPVHGYESYLVAALDAAGATHATWRRAALGALAAAELAAFDKIIWDAGEALPALADADRAALDAYLAPGNPGYSPAAADWFTSHTGAGFAADDAYATALDGVAGDPLGDGLAFAIAGGDGADNQDYPDELTSAPNARACLEYGPGRPAAVRFGLGDARIVTLGFGFEGVDTAAHRSQLLQRILDWFDDAAVGVDTPAATGAALRLQAAPNPFNPRVRLRLAGEGPATLSIRDLQGRLVRTLLSGVQEIDGLVVDWDGLDADGRRAGAGLYFAHLATPAGERVLKLTLVK